MMGKDTYLGAGSFSLFLVSGEPKVEYKLDLYEKGKNNGNLTVDIDFK